MPSQSCCPARKNQESGFALSPTLLGPPGSVQTRDVLEEVGGVGSPKAGWDPMEDKADPSLVKAQTLFQVDRELPITGGIQALVTSPSTYSMTIHKWRRVSKEQNMLTTNGFSAKVRMSRSTKTCWIWLRRIRFCLLIFLMAKRCRVSRCRTR